MRIINLQAENIKRLIAVDITPKGNMVEITGRNGAGKSSVLDAIWWALAGTRSHQPEPIRRGEENAEITLDLGEYVVRRTFRRREGDEITTQLFVETGEGARFTSPQDLVNDLLGTLAFDPLEFSRMDPGGQYRILRGFVEGIDFESEEQAHKRDFATRTDVNRRQKERRTLAASIGVPDAPETMIDVSELNARIARAEEVNDERRAAHENRRRAHETAHRLQGRVEDADAEVIRLNAMVKLAEDEVALEKGYLADARKALDALPESAALIEIAPLREDMLAASARNALVDKARDALAMRETHRKVAAELEDESNALTASMEARTERLRDAVAKADMPVDGITLRDGGVLLNDLPLEQASHAEVLGISCAIAMRQNATLRVLRIREGAAVLDEDGYALLAQMATDRDYQVWIERVDTSGKIGFVIEDGQMAGAEAVEEAS